ncbi:MAG: tRNA epoxyqueuosine(34) reductase QueG [Bacteroidaceae bacterium]|nr:tRNA epoxyqueuosine(34) reductase QueG [Bacteroidaceae bacterium]
MERSIEQAIRAEALRLGFSACGFAKAEPVSNEVAQTIDHWVEQGNHADMSYMERNRHLRLDPTQLVPGCRTLIVTALNYYPKQTLPKESYQIAYYAYGADYHRVVKDKLYQLLTYIKDLVPGVQGRAFCDTAPLLERYWAVKAGLGFIGQNRTLIIPGKGSYCFLGVLAVDMDLQEEHHDMPTSCGNCKRCLMACPTGALTVDGIDCRRCLSYLTIEHRATISPDFIGKLGNRIYGCDTCQQACPHNRNAEPTSEAAFDLPAPIAAFTRDDWHSLTPERYRELFKHSAIERAGYDGLMRNIEAVHSGSKE